MKKNLWLLGAGIGLILLSAAGRRICRRAAINLLGAAAVAAAVRVLDRD